MPQRAREPSWISNGARRGPRAAKWRQSTDGSPLQSLHFLRVHNGRALPLTVPCRKELAPIRPLAANSGREARGTYQSPSVNEDFTLDKSDQWHATLARGWLVDDSYWPGATAKPADLGAHLSNCRFLKSRSLHAHQNRCRRRLDTQFIR